MWDSNIFEAWLLQVLAIELPKHLRSDDKLGSRVSSPFTDFVTLLKDKILQFLWVDAKIKDLGDFKFFFAINLNWR